MVKDMTAGPVRGHLISMTLFMLIGMAVQMLYGLIDIYWVGRLGKEAVAAVSIASNMMFIVLAATQMLSVGVVALVAQAAGRKEHAEVQRLFNQAQSLSLVLGALFMAASLSGRDLYVRSIAGDTATAQLASQFLVWFLPAQGSLFLMTGLGASLRGIGSMKPGLYAQTGSVLLNMVLAPFLIFGWVTGHAFGVAGAGMATLAGAFAATIGLTLYLMRDSTYLRVNFASWKPDWKTWRRILLIGLPSGSEFIVMSISLTVSYTVLKSFGAEAQAGFGIGMRVMQTGFMPAIAMSFAIAAVCGQNYGARRHDRVIELFRESVKIVLGFMLLYTVLCLLLAEPMIRTFSADPSVESVGASYLRTMSLVFMFNGLVMVSSGIFQGVGNTWPSLAASASRIPVYAIPVLWLSHRPGFNMQQVWNASALAVVFQLGINLLMLRREFRLKLYRTPEIPPAGTVTS